MASGQDSDRAYRECCYLLDKARECQMRPVKGSAAQIGCC